MLTLKAISVQSWFHHATYVFLLFSFYVLNKTWCDKRMVLTAGKQCDMKTGNM